MNESLTERTRRGAKKAIASRLGTKRQCFACGAKFYDLNRTPPVCSRCGAAAGPKTGQGRARSRPCARRRTSRPAPARRQPGMDARTGRGDRQGRALAEEGRAAGLPAVRLCRRRQDDARPPCGRGRRRRRRPSPPSPARPRMVMRAARAAPGRRRSTALSTAPREGEDGTPNFTLNEDGPAAKAGLIVIDECSMVDEELGRDLLSFGKPILVLGDPVPAPAGQGRRLSSPMRPAGRDADRDPPSGGRQSDHPPVRDRPLGRRAREGDYGESAGRSGARRWSRGRCSPPIRCWSAPTGPAAPTMAVSAN